MSVKIEIPKTELRAFCQRHHIQELALFGSALRPDFRADSDLDILVEFEPSARIGLMTFARIQRELSELFHRPVDLVTRAGLKAVIKQAVLDQAEVIYAA